nr:DUF1993 family protein [Telluria antibiotica]
MIFGACASRPYDGRPARHAGPALPALPEQARRLAGSGRGVRRGRRGAAPPSRHVPAAAAAVPNFFFHYSMVYAIARQAAVPVGKSEFDGYHRYPSGFTFAAQ